MKRYDLVIIDDDNLAIEIVEKYCNIYAIFNVVGKFTNPILGYDFVENNSVDLLFLDVNMPEMSGLCFVGALTKKISTIIISTNKEHAFDFFMYDFVFAYLSKPIEVSVFHNRIQHFIQMNKDSNQNWLFVNHNKMFIKIEIEEIYIVEARSDYVYIKTKNKNYIVKSSMKNISKKLPRTLFYRVHKSYIVNMSRIESIQKSIIIINNEHIPLSKAISKSFYNKINCL